MIITQGSIVFDENKVEYKVLEHLKSGGFGSVFKAECCADKSIWALKTLPSGFVDPTVYRSFQNECIIASQIKHENVIYYRERCIIS